jgi:hypothetical protein
MSPSSFFNRTGNDSATVEAIKKDLKKAAADAEADPENQGVLQGNSVPNVLADVPTVPGQKQLQKAQQAATQEKSNKKKSTMTPGGSRSSSGEDDDTPQNPPG